MKLYFQEMIGNWPKYRYKKYKRDYMKKHGVQISYGNVHTNAIKHCLKEIKHERDKQDSFPVNVAGMMTDLVRQTVFLSLDPDLSIAPKDIDTQSLSSYKTAENEWPDNANQQKSTITKIKHKIKKSLRRKKISTTNNNNNTNHEDTSNSDEYSQTNQSPEQV